MYHTVRHTHFLSNLSLYLRHRAWSYPWVDQHAFSQLHGLDIRSRTSCGGTQEALPAGRSRHAEALLDHLWLRCDSLSHRPRCSPVWPPGGLSVRRGVGRVVH